MLSAICDFQSTLSSSVSYVKLVQTPVIRLISVKSLVINELQACLQVGDHQEVNGSFYITKVDVKPNC